MSSNSRLQTPPKNAKTNGTKARTMTTGRLQTTDPMRKAKKVKTKKLLAQMSWCSEDKCIIKGKKKLYIPKCALYCFTNSIPWSVFFQNLRNPSTEVVIIKSVLLAIKGRKKRRKKNEFVNSRIEDWICLICYRELKEKDRRTHFVTAIKLTASLCI